MKLIQSKSIVPLIIAAFAFTGTIWATSKPAAQSEASNMQSPLSRSEKHFLQSAAEINTTQADLGKLAVKQSTDPKIREIGENLIRDHAQANKDLEKLAASKGIKLHETPTFFQQRGLSALQQTTGTEFDQQFLKMVGIGHERAVSLFTRASQRSQDPAIKEWAGKMLPGLEKHMAMIRTEQSKVVAEKPQKMEGKRQKAGDQPQEKKQPQPQY